MVDINNLLLEIDSILYNYFDSISPALTDIVVRKMSTGKGIAHNIAKAKVTSSLLHTSRFTKLKEINAMYSKFALKELVNTLNVSFDILDKQVGITTGRLEFLKEVKSTFRLLTKDIPADIHRVLINQVAINLVKDTKADTIRKLASSINKSMRQTEILLKETIVILSREHIHKIYKKLPKKTLYSFVGVLDSRTSAICKDFLSQPAMTMQQWQTLKSDIFINGGHMNCRHLTVLAENDNKSGTKLDKGE